ncbi:MAG: hypothetical protein NTV03_00470 [Candidatus Nomurabacteria bacterium]|nr:hypothetical protein [Candidatus Nomurabacteria bacterium]
MKKFLYFILIVCILNILSMPSFSIAEMQVNTQEDEIIVTVSPKNPQPYEDVSINISSYATDLNKAVISWQIDSKIMLSGIGKTDYSFKALGPNTTTNLNIIIRPVGSDGNISYSWKNNDNIVTDASGYNKNSFIFNNDLFDTENIITVIASAVSENYNAEKTITISAYSPKVLFYKKSPTEGTLYNNALNSDTIFGEGDEMTIVAVPYFLALKGNEDKFNYSWTINGDPINTPSKKIELTIRPTSRGGYADISIVLESMNKLFQKVIGQLKLTL